MDLRFTPDEQAFREEVRAFLRAELPEEIRRKVLNGQLLAREDTVRWQRILNRKDWAVPAWPREWGGTGWDAVRQYIFKEEMNQAYAPEPLGFNVNMLGPVLMAFGTEEQKRFFLPRMANLDIWFCQGFSEPGSGSDLASLKTRAVRDGGDYVINGQKIWTSLGHHADWMFGLVRTDPEAKKQKGITYLLIDMKTPGISVRPIITLDGMHHTNEVFFDNVRVPVKNRVGEENQGWNYAKFLLGNERLGIARVGVSKSRIARAKQLAAEVLVDGRPLAENARFRERMAAAEVELKALEITNMRVVHDVAKANRTEQDPKASILKIKGSELQQAATEILLEVAGPDALRRETGYVRGEADSVGPDWAAARAGNYFYHRADSIYGGSNEIQHNIIAKAILGL
jgi:alkylation response protein AidB-like acyl-CoA dehydrogenase